MNASGVCEGWVRHRRFAPRPHSFRYRLFMMYLDLDELDQVFRGRWLWSARRPAAARFDRRDHLGAPDENLAQAVRNLVGAETGQRPGGPVRVLTHLRYFGYRFNPVSFFFCFDQDDRHLEAIVAEVNNTPWGEQHPYVLRPEHPVRQGATVTFEFPKRFHVSPFMPMDLRYRWRFRATPRHIAVHMENLRGDACIFDATMVLERRPISGPVLAGVLIRYPLMTVKVIAAIYYEALRLWLKKVTFHTHPAKALAEKPRSM